MMDLRNIVIKALSDDKKHFATIEADYMFIVISCFNKNAMYALCGKDENGGWEFRFICDEKEMEDIKRDYEVHDFKVAII